MESNVGMVLFLGLKITGAIMNLELKAGQVSWLSSGKRRMEDLPACLTMLLDVILVI